MLQIDFEEFKDKHSLAYKFEMLENGSNLNDEK